MLLKTLIPCYFRFGWRSRALGTEGQALWAVLVVMATVSWTASSSTNCGLFSPKTLCAYFPVTRDDSRWKRASRLRGPIQLLRWWYERKGNCFFFVCFFKWRPLLPRLCFQPRISEIENFKTTSSNKDTENILFYKAHAYAIVLGWFPLFSTDSVVFVDRETPNNLHTSTLELRFLT